MSQQPLLSQLVVVGSSAGGIEALSTLVATLPTPFPAPLIFAQHLDPARSSHLGEILARRSPLPVITVRQRELLQPGTIYVVPANHHVEVTDHEITLLLDGAGRPKPSIDLLLSSAAAVYGERLVAVILTGTGSDGASGARDVKAAGGTVFIQNPRTAAYPGMPGAVAPQFVDIEADLPRIGPILFDLLTGVIAPLPADAGQELERFLSLVHTHTGINFRAYKTPTILRRLQRRIVATSSGDLAGYQQYLIEHPDEYPRLTSSFLIKVTEFMRDPELFASLRDTVLPELIAASSERGNELRCWSAGCATGEEAYSLAILLLETLGAALPDFNVKIFATDLDADAITLARRGLYPPDALVHLSPELVGRYFIPADGGYSVTKQVRGLVVFGEHDLGQRAPFPRIDLVLCRNVLIYFSRELQQRALQLFAFALREGGYLALGKAETVSPTPDFFVPAPVGHKLYRRQGKQRPNPPFSAPEYARPLTGLRNEQRRNKETSSALLQATTESARSRAAQDQLLLNLPVGVVMVDRRYDIHEINGAARRLLGIHTAAIGDDLVHLAHRIPNQPLRAVLDQAIRSHTPSMLPEVELRQLTTGEPIYLQIQCIPQPGAAGENAAAVDRVLVLVSDITAQVVLRRELERTTAELTRGTADLQRTSAALAASHDETGRLSAALDEARQMAAAGVERHTQQIDMLVAANGELLAANDELTLSNSDLRGRCEDFMQTNEEAQAAIEEAETLNEEMQATNEELETLNEEMQATVEELHTSNTDLAARGDELQSLAVSLQTQAQQIARDKAQLEAILASLADAVLVVSADETPLLSNGAYQQLFWEGTIRPQLIGRVGLLADAQGDPLPPEQTPWARAARGETFNMDFTLQQEVGGERRWFEALGRPLRGDGPAAGVVVVRDITERSMRILQDEFIALAAHELRTPLTIIRGYINLLAKRLKSGESGERTFEYVAQAATQVERLMRLINDLLDVSRLQNGKFELQCIPLRLDNLLEGIVESGAVLGSGPQVVLTIDESVGTRGSAEDAEEVLLVDGDAGRLEQALLNLVNNARIHAPASPQIDLRLSLVDSMAEIAVQDYGSGIAPEHLAALFGRFYQVGLGRTSATMGLGLGLFITEQIINGHGGTVTVNSLEGVGTTFLIRLPLWQPTSERLG